MKLTLIKIVKIKLNKYKCSEQSELFFYLKFISIFFDLQYNIFFYLI